MGAYLRARRELVTPEDAGLPRGPRRRVPGLRREELAVLAGISPEYYLRLEKGRDRHPSPEVLDALAGVLRLDADAVAHLHRIAGAGGYRSGRVVSAGAVAPGVARLLDDLGVPAFVQGPLQDVLAANALAQALSPQYRPGVNLLRAVFLDPRDRVLHQDWDRATREAVAGLRAQAGTDLDDPLLQALVSELSAGSERFRRLWARQDVRQKVGGTSRMLHPDVGPLELRHEKFTVNGSDGQVLVAYHAEPGSPSRAALGALAALASRR
ncbi:helix-turn-helix domain-containing protein [Kineococcus sp. R8]|nr:helix-turn-helix transcriptional regulator [Kineococcus siccus]NAZ83273.1 helix-turn-helix domain-containing protein [Kineococcus siccus]